MSTQKNMKCFLLLLFISVQICAQFEKTYFQGKWKLTESAVKSYGFAHEDQFGTFVVFLPEKKVFIPDLLYVVDQNQNLGIRVIPIKDHDVSAPIDENGVIVPQYNNSDSHFRWGNGSELLDSYCKSLMFGDENSNEDIFAIASYHHPNAKGEEYLTQNRISHAAAYIGKGQLRNSPVAYHNYRWEIKKYPAHLYSISLKGVKQSILNKNMKITLQLLNQTNYGPKFSENYEFDWFANHNLKETLEFYRGWIDPSYIRKDLNQKFIDAGVDIDINTPYQDLLLNEKFLETYCSEHITIAINCGLNIPQTEQGYQEIWGEDEGRILFRKANQMWQKITGKNIPQEELRQFTNPLWKHTINTRKLITHPDIIKTGVAMGWKPETSADLIADFITQYAKFTETSFIFSSIAILKFAPAIQYRMGIDIKKYFSIATKFIEKMLEQDIRLFAAKNNFSNISVEKQNEMIDFYLNKMQKIFKEELNEQPELEKIINNTIDNVKKKKAQLISKPITHASFDAENRVLIDILKIKIPNKNTLTLNEIAWLQFRIAVCTKSSQTNGEHVSLMDLARNIRVKIPSIVKQVAADSRYVQYYSSPAIFHKIARGLHIDLVNKDVLILPLATAFYYKEVDVNPFYDASTDNKEELRQMIEDMENNH